jgi:hypothetical protein
MIVGDVAGIVDATVTVLGAIITAAGIAFVVRSLRWHRQDQDEATRAKSLHRPGRDERDTRQQFRAGLSLGIGLIVAGLVLVVIGLAL